MRKPQNIDGLSWSKRGVRDEVGLVRSYGARLVMVRKWQARDSHSGSFDQLVFVCETSQIVIPYCVEVVANNLSRC